MIHPKITFANTDIEPAGKVRLTKTLFRQVIVAPLCSFDRDKEDNRDCPDSKTDVGGIESVNLNGAIIGFVNYFWKECVRFHYGIWDDDDGHARVIKSAACWDSQYGQSGSTLRKLSSCLHILWVTPDGQLRRCIFSKRLWERLRSELQHDELKQVFLGGVLFA